MLISRPLRLIPRGSLILVAALAPALACTPGTGPPSSVASKLALVGTIALLAQSGLPFAPQPVLQVQDGVGDPVAGAGRLITAVLSTTGGALLGTAAVRTDASGRAAFANLAISAPIGAWRLRFDSPGLSSVTTDPIQLSAGLVSTLVSAAGNLQTSVAGTPVAIPPAVRATDAAGNPVAGVPVAFAVNNGGSVDGAATVTGADGMAAPTAWTLGTTLGLNTLTATSSALPGVSVSFTATGSVGPPALLTIVAGEAQTAAVGGDTPVKPAVRLTDAFGHPLPSVTVSFTVTGGGGAVTAGNPLTDAAGIATVGSWNLGLLPGANALTSSRAGVPSIVLNATGVDFVVSTIAVGNGHSCALAPSGAAFCWGLNANGQIGNGAFAPVSVPTAVSGGLVFTSIGVGTGHTCGVVENGDGYCWGANDSGQLGVGTLIPRSTPTQILGPYKYTMIVPSAGFTCGLQVGGAAQCWGFGQNGQLGTGSNTSQTLPSAVSGSLVFNSLTTGGSHACGLGDGGVVFCWGFNGNGRLGDGTTTSRNIPTLVDAPISGPVGFASVSAGGSHTCGVATTGAAYCWGQGAAGRLGIGAVTDQLEPTEVTGGLLFSAISAHIIHSCGITTTAQAYCWGGNGFGELGDGTIATRNAPTAVLGGLSFTALLAGGEQTCGRGGSGGAYCWGRNDNGQVGDGTILNRLKPVGAVRP